MNQKFNITIPSLEQKKLFQFTNSKKYKVILLLMLDCGLRVSKVIQIQCKHISFTENKINIVSAKKSRKIPLTQRLLKSLADYWQDLKDSNPDSYLFPSGKKSKIARIGRKQIWKKINQLSKGKANPTILRNTFAARIVQENELSVAKELLGDISISTTERHITISETERESAIQSIEQDDFITKLFRRFFPTQTIHIIPGEIGITNFHIGRKDEMQKLHDCGKKKINPIVLALFL